MSEMREVESPEQLEALYARYPITGTLVTGHDTASIHAYDSNGNQLIVTMRSGEKIQCQEIPAKKQEV